MFENFFNRTKKEAPKVVWATYWGVTINYDINLKILYDFYKLNPYIASCVNRIKTDIWAYGIVLKKENTKWWVEQELDPKIFWKYTPKKFLERLVRDVEVTWNGYIYIAKSESGKAEQLQLLDPRYITPIQNDQWVMLWYIQNLNWIRAFLTDEVFHFMDDTDLNNEAIGKSKMTSLFIDLESDKEASESNLAFFKNNQTPSSIVVIDPKFNASDDIDLKKKIKDLFEGWQFQGWKNHYRSTAIQWVQEVIKVQDKINDRQFIELRKLSMKLVCAVYSVPQDLIWFTETSNRSVWDIQSEIYYNTILAKEEAYEQFFTEIIQVFYWSEYEIEILQDNLRQLERKAKIAWTLYKEYELIDLNEAREIIQYDTRKEWDILYQNKIQDKNLQKKKE